MAPVLSVSKKSVLACAYFLLTFVVAAGAEASLIGEDVRWQCPDCAPPQDITFTVVEGAAELTPFDQLEIDVESESIRITALINALFDFDSIFSELSWGEDEGEIIGASIDPSSTWLPTNLTFGPNSVEINYVSTPASAGDFLLVNLDVAHVPVNTPPVASCTESVNPAGENTPPAGSTTLPGSRGGQNEDGLYALVGEDAEDGTALVFVTNASGSATFGPFSSGLVVKITEAPGRTPTAKFMGGPSSAVAAHITLDSDAFVFAVDSFGEESPVVSCLVPPPPK
jgi:hypothetical protein